MEQLSFLEAYAIAKATVKNGGYSFEQYNHGYMVSIEGSERVISLLNNDLTNIAFQLQEFFEEYQTVNTWIDEGKIYLDVSIHVNDLATAKKLGKREQQQAIYDCKEGKSIRL